MRLTVLVAAIEAAATGAVLIVTPPLFGWLIFDAAFAEAGHALARLTGIALLGLALACWPTSTTGGTSAARALLIYNVLAAIYLLYLAVGGRLVGVLLWPAVVLHAILSAFLARALLRRNIPIEGAAILGERR